MSLSCGEHWELDEYYHGSFLVTEVIFAVQLPGSDHYTAVCQAVIDAIPKPERHPAVVPNGLSVHRGHSRPNGPFLSQYLSWSDFELGDFLFALTADTASHYLPRLWQRITGP